MNEQLIRARLTVWLIKLGITSEQYQEEIISVLMSDIRGLRRAVATDEGAAS